MGPIRQSAKWRDEIAGAKANLRTQLLNITKAIDAIDQHAITSPVKQSDVATLLLELGAALDAAAAKAEALATAVAKGGR